VYKPTGISIFSQTYRTDNKKGGAGAGIFGNVEALATFATEPFRLWGSVMRFTMGCRG